MISELSQLDGDTYKMNIGLFTRVRNMETFKEDTIYILVQAKASADLISEDALNLYVSRVITDNLANAVNHFKKRLIFYQYTVLDEANATHILNLKIKPDGLKLAIQEKGKEAIPVLGGSSEYSWYFRHD